MEFKDVINAHYDAEQGGSILIRCEGGYVARFTVSYTFQGKEFSKHSGNISLGVNKSESIPAGATNIHLKVEEMWGFGWSTIFTKDFGSPVTKKYKVYGTTLNPKYSEI
ncbi:thiol-activated cytolysin C-terminal domain-containing protein [Cytophagaceae bacterium ABcell3]|nr:thiol-activated cytolysin C-terminal domain-containing protein [Cytophagaceae bacterium ABcell3]